MPLKKTVPSNTLSNEANGEFESLSNFLSIKLSELAKSIRTETQFPFTLTSTVEDFK